MRVLVVAHWFPLTVAQHFAKAFRQEGNEVVTIGPTWGHWIPWCGGTMLPKANLPDITIPPGTIVRYEKIKEAVGDIDLIFCLEPHPLVIDIPKSTVSVGQATDNHVRDVFAEEFDWQFIAHSWGRGADAKNVKWLPCAYDPEENFDMGLERDIDLAMIGCIYQHRFDAVTYLVNHNVTVNLAWGRINPEWNALYNRAKTALCFSYAQDASDRILENMAQGCAVIADRGIADLEKMGIREMQHYLAFENHAELVEHVEQCRDEDFRQTIVQRAKHALAGQTWQDRIREIVKVTGG
jgi:hypothetical protein